jgi:hypothetical protein
MTIDKQNRSLIHLFPVIDETVLEESLKADPSKVLPHGKEQVQVLVQVRIELNLWGAARKQEHLFKLRLWGDARSDFTANTLLTLWGAERKPKHYTVAGPDPGSGAFWSLDQGSGRA